MEQSKFHKNFQLNGVSFANVDEILAYSKDFSTEILHFLETWFSIEESITVQTSGSTGIPKSIQLQKELMKNSAKATGEFFQIKENTTALLCLPIQYIAGKMMLIRAITLGWQIDVIEPNSNPLESVNAAYDFSAMVPLQLENSLPKIGLIKKLIVGGGVVSNALKEKLQHTSTEIFATYGMTETITHIAVKKLNNFSNVISSEVEKSLFYLGKFYQTLPNVIIYKDQRNCLVIDAPKVSEELVVTNDVVQLISDTQFEWLGRYDNVINSGGIKLHPEKIEVKLSEIILNRFFVTGIKDEKLGEKLILIIEQKDKGIENVISSEVEKSLYDKIKNLDVLSKFEIPKEIHFINQFVETETGKIQRLKTITLLNK